MLLAVIGVGVVGAVAVVATLFVVDGRARDADEVRVVEVPFNRSGVGGATVGRIVFIASDRTDDPDLLAHELVHVCQWEELGLEFLWEYSSEFVANYRELPNRREAYTAISFEEQARAGTAECDLDRYRISTG